MKKIIVLLVCLGLFALIFFHDCAGASRSASANSGPSGNIAVDSICYRRHIAPLLNSRCAPCHVGQSTAGVRIDSHDAAKARINDIIAQTETGAMPQGGPALSHAQIDTLKAWKQNGEKACAN